MAFEGKAESEAGFLSILFILTKLKREKPFFFLQCQLKPVSFKALDRVRVFI